VKNFALSLHKRREKCNHILEGAEIFLYTYTYTNRRTSMHVNNWKSSWL